MKFRFIGAVIAAAWAALPSAARAQDCSTISYVPVPGNAGSSVAHQAFRGFAGLYGAATVAERDVLPILRQVNPDKEFAAAVHLRSNALYGAGRQLIVSEQNTPGCPTALRSDYDLYAATMGFAFRYKALSVFYITSSIGGQPEANGYGRAFNPLAAVAVAGVYTVIAPLVGPWNVEQKGVTITGDYIAGAQLEVEGFNFAAGYIGSSGLYTNISQEKIRAFASAAIAREFKELAYLKAGLDRLAVIQGELSSIYARKLTFSPPSQFTPDGFRVPTTKGINLWTAHLDQMNIGKIFDLKGALGVQSTVFLHTLQAGLHTEQFVRDPLAKIRSSEGAVGLEVGTVKIPENRALGQPGGQLLSIRAIVRLYPENRLPSDLSLALSFNDPEVIVVFPSAHNVVSLQAGGTFGTE